MRQFLLRELLLDDLALPLGFRIGHWAVALYLFGSPFGSLPQIFQGVGYSGGEN